MIQRETILKVVDNSGARSAQCIGIPGSNNPKSAETGDIITVAVKTLRKSAVASLAAQASGGLKSKGKKGGLQVSKGSVMKALIVRTKKDPRGVCSFSENAVIRRNAKGEPRGSRISGPRLTYTLYNKKRWKAVARGRQLLDR
jgi:large subunit ribosomal protein L14